MSEVKGKKSYREPNRIVYAVMRGILVFLVKLLTKFRVEGIENAPLEGRVIFVTNHLHYFDTPVGFTAAPRKGTPIVALDYKKHIFGWIVSMLGAIFINRGEVDRQALTQAMEVLNDEGAIIMAVEGTRSRTGGLQEGKIGSAYLASRTNSPIVPVAMFGTEKVIPAWKKLRRAEVIVRVGEPFYLEEGRHRTEKLYELTDLIMMRLAELLPASYRGVYADRFPGEE